MSGSEIIDDSEVRARRLYEARKGKWPSEIYEEGSRKVAQAVAELRTRDSPAHIAARAILTDIACRRMVGGRVFDSWQHVENQVIPLWASIISQALAPTDEAEKSSHQRPTDQSDGNNPRQ